jgi:hypothetical protein
VYRGYGHALGSVDVRGPIHGQPFGDGLVRLRAASGVLEKLETPDRETAVGGLARWIHGLHTVEYGGTLARWLLFVLALGGCATLLTGNWIWIERRAAARTSLFTTLLARLTAGIGAGCFAALGALLLSSRLLPLEDTARILHEELAMASTFAVWVLLGLLTRDTAALWWRGLALAGALLFATPFAAARHSAFGLFGSGASHSVVLGVDAVLLAAGLVLLGSGLTLRRWQRQHRAAPGAPSAPDIDSVEPSSDLGVVSLAASSGALDTRGRS